MTEQVSAQAMIGEVAPLWEKLWARLTPSIQELGYRIVHLSIASRGKHNTLQVLAERLDGESVSVSDCEKIHYQVSAILDVEDPISGAYMLEIASPGSQRPLTRLEDFTRFAGEWSSIELTMPIDSRKRFLGTLGAVEGTGAKATVKLTMEEGEVRLPMAQIKTAKLAYRPEKIRHVLREDAKKKRTNKS